MADLKISQLPSATTPLAGTEVLPIVQSSATKQVSIANLTAGRSISVADATLTTGNLVIGTSGKGIDFSATGEAGGMTSELLADYEEGGWTPTYSTTGGSFVYAQQHGTYVKIGRLVYCTIWLQTSSATVGTGSVSIVGLPYSTNPSATFRGGSGAIGFANGFVTQAPIQAYWPENQTKIVLQYTSAGNTVDLNASNLTTGVGNYIYASFAYPTAS